MGTFFFLLAALVVVIAFAKLHRKKAFELPASSGRKSKPTAREVATPVEDWDIFVKKMDEESERKKLPDHITVNVLGAEPYAYADTHKNDIEMMILCAKAELLAAEKNNWYQAPNPFYFQRVAILARKQKSYEHEVKICEALLDCMAKWTARMREKGLEPGRDIANIAAGPRVDSIAERLPKARELLSKSQEEPSRQRRR